MAGKAMHLPQRVTVQGREYDACFLGTEPGGRERYALMHRWDYREVEVRAEEESVLVGMEGRDWVLEGAEIVHPDLHGHRMTLAARSPGSDRAAASVPGCLLPTHVSLQGREYETRLLGDDIAGRQLYRLLHKWDIIEDVTVRKEGEETLVFIGGEDWVLDDTELVRLDMIEYRRSTSIGLQ